jgi:internalin A
MTTDQHRPPNEIDLIPDAGLARALAKKLPGGVISIEALQRLRDLDASEQSISSLAGLEYCTSLEGLSLQDNNVTDLSPISALSNLELLSLNHNPVADMSVIGTLPELRELFVGKTNVSDLKFIAQFPKLELLSFVYSQVTSLTELYFAVFITKTNQRFQRIVGYGNNLDAASYAFAEALRNNEIEVSI